MLRTGSTDDVLLRVQSTGAHVQEIHAHACEGFGKLDGVFDLPAFHVLFPLEPVGGGNAEEEWHAVGDLGAGLLDQFAREAGAIFKAAAVRVCAFVAGGAEEGVEEVAAAGAISWGSGWGVIIVISL